MGETTFKPGKENTIPNFKVCLYVTRQTFNQLKCLGDKVMNQIHVLDYSTYWQIFIQIHRTSSGNFIGDKVRLSFIDDKKNAIGSLVTRKNKRIFK